MSATLRREWQRLYRSQPPPRIRRDLLILAIAWKLQAQRRGGLTAAQKRKLAHLAEDLRQNGDLSKNAGLRLKPGATLVREWRGVTQRVRVTDRGFEWQGKPHRSLTAVAQAITGARWSGPRFFGLRRGAKPFNGQAPVDG